MIVIITIITVAATAASTGAPDRYFVLPRRLARVLSNSIIVPVAFS